MMFDEPYSFYEQTMLFRNELPPEYESFIVISVDASGNPIGFFPDNDEIITYDFDFGGRYKIAENFIAFLEQMIN